MLHKALIRRLRESARKTLDKLLVQRSNPAYFVSIENDAAHLSQCPEERGISVSLGELLPSRKVIRLVHAATTEVANSVVWSFNDSFPPTFLVVWTRDHSANMDFLDVVLLFKSKASYRRIISSVALLDRPR